MKQIKAYTEEHGIVPITGIPLTSMTIARLEKGKVMSRYIDADALKEWLDEYLSVFKKYDKGTIKGFVDHAPSIDIVKCKECIWRDIDNQGEEYCTYVKGLSDINESSFCSWGERREP